MFEFQSQIVHDFHCFGMETLSFLLKFLIALDEVLVRITFGILDILLRFHPFDGSDYFLVIISQLCQYFEFGFSKHANHLLHVRSGQVPSLRSGQAPHDRVMLLNRAELLDRLWDSCRIVLESELFGLIQQPASLRWDHQWWK